MSTSVQHDNCEWPVTAMRPTKLDTETTIEIAGRLQDAAADATRWTDALHVLRRAFRAQSATLLTASKGAPLAVQSRVHVGPAMSTLQADLLKALHNGDPRALWARDHLGRAGACSVEVGTLRMRASEIYRRILQSIDVEDSLMLAEQVDERSVVTLLLTRGRNEPPFGPEEVGALQSVRPLFVRALRTHARAVKSEGLLADFQSAFNRLPVGVVIVDHEQRVRFTSDKAARLLSPADGLAIQERELRAEQYGPDRRLQAAIAQALAAPNGHGPTVEDTLTVKRTSKGRDFEILVAPLRTTPRGVVPPAPAAMVVIRDPEESSSLPWQLVQQLYGLSPAESKLSVALAGGAALKEYALHNQISVETARSQLKAAMSKTRTHRQVELIRMILTGPAAFASLHPHVPAPMA